MKEIARGCEIPVIATQRTEIAEAVTESNEFGRRAFGSY